MISTISIFAFSYKLFSKLLCKSTAAVKDVGAIRETQPVIFQSSDVYSLPSRLRSENCGTQGGLLPHIHVSLLSLRALTESKGGRMEVASIPAFRLTIFLPERETWKT